MPAGFRQPLSSLWGIAHFGYTKVLSRDAQKCFPAAGEKRSPEPGTCTSEGLFTQVPRSGILRSPYTRYWITPPNTPAAGGWRSRSPGRAGRYYLMLDSYARYCIGPGEPTSHCDLLRPRLPRVFLENQRLVRHPLKRGYYCRESEVTQAGSP
jgi:hypothetical protein